MKNKIGNKGTWTARCYKSDGSVKWEENWDNLITNVGLDYSLESSLAGGSQTTTWYVGLTNSSPTANSTDTMASHPGWTEVTNYDEAGRPVWTPGAVSGQSVNNSGSAAVFTGSTDGTVVGGAFLVSDNSKGGSAGKLFSVGPFTIGNKTLDAGDTLEVTAEYGSSSV